MLWLGKFSPGKNVFFVDFWSLHDYTLTKTHTGRFEVKNNTASMVTVCFASLKRLVNFKGKDCISHTLQDLAGIHEHVDNSCKRGAEYLHCFLVIVHTECGQFQTAFIQEKSAYIVEISVMEQILRKFPNSQKSW